MDSGILQSTILLNWLGLVLVPLVVPLAMAWSKRLKSIDNNLQAICTELAIHKNAIDDLKNSPRAWHNERDQIKADLKSLEVKLR